MRPMRPLQVALALLFSLAAMPAMSLTCPRPPAPEIQVTDISEPVAIDRSKGIAELTFLRRPGPGLHSNGLYTSTLQHRMDLRFSIARDRQMACVTVEQVRAEAGFRERTIHIARNYAVGTCEAGAILDHERRHVAADERLFQQELPALRSALERSARTATAGPIPVSQIEAVQAKLTERLKTDFELAISAFNKRRDAAQGAIDVPTEYDRVQRLCPGGWR
jgi:hypothetical protein